MNLKDLFSKKKSDPHCSVVIVAAGSGERMGADKVFLDLAGVPVLARTLKPFQDSECVDEIVIVTRTEKLSEVSDLCSSNGFTKVSKVVSGGATRTESALAGVSEVGPKTKLIAIHDAARPFITKELISSLVSCADQFMAAVPAVRCADTIRIVDDEGVITGDTDRNYAVQIQTPQIFDADIIKGALSYAVTHERSLTDDSSAAKMMGVKVHTVSGDPDNIKLTVPDDLIKGAAILKSRGES
ncbi:MAG: 2-C-methyl-D-erythritol 4-phosphate cytidylyltransferase [Oscillospiraceae bacterium]|nr:2-C-methyl-D-erythritol 4-phosphate cytidylyltransferase [Oscillospiraceae bacterium]